ncbi:MAG TPA: CAP domain-containing protein [Flavisolibacter sp.]|nr:CAP domain-containing protein [Flavisolibacter sp.]
MKAFFLFLFLLATGTTPKEPILDRNEAKEAFRFLNQVRTKPEQFYKEFPFLKEYKKRHLLQWNDTLAKAAEAKALDMATNNYFDHVDKNGFAMNHYIHKAGYQLKPSWIKTPTENYFESLNAESPSGREVVKSLLIDEGVPSLGHRRHLLGIDPFYESLYDIGIGFAKRDSGSAHKTYTCILIAKHN